MDNTKANHNVKQPITSMEEMEKALKEVEGQEQLYSIAFFDILGFSNFVENNGSQVILDLYNNLLDIIHKQQSMPDGTASEAGQVVPAPASPDWKFNHLIANANGFVRVCHFSDTFIIYVNYRFAKRGFWLRDTKYEPHPLLFTEKDTPFDHLICAEHPVYLSFLQTCMEFFCQSIVAGIPLRGCISTGMALMDQDKSIYFGRPLIEAARGEPVQNSIGVAYGKSFSNYHPVYNDYFIPYLDHIKENDARASFLSPMALDWPRFWRRASAYQNVSLKDCINKMNGNSAFSAYYDNAIKFTEFSEKHENWSDEINYEGLDDIHGYYERVKEWFKEAKKI